MDEGREEMVKKRGREEKNILGVQCHPAFLILRVRLISLTGGFYEPGYCCPVLDQHCVPLYGDEPPRKWDVVFVPKNLKYRNDHNGIADSRFKLLDRHRPPRMRVLVYGTV